MARAAPISRLWGLEKPAKVKKAGVRTVRAMQASRRWGKPATKAETPKAASNEKSSAEHIRTAQSAAAPLRKRRGWWVRA